MSWVGRARSDGFAHGFHAGDEGPGALIGVVEREGGEAGLPVAFGAEIVAQGPEQAGEVLKLVFLRGADGAVDLVREAGDEANRLARAGLGGGDGGGPVGGGKAGGRHVG